MKAIHGVVTGHVQGVGYRQGCRSIARANHLVGWVRNRADGRVELHAQGAEEGLDVLVTWLWGGPAWADVVGVETEVVPIDLTLTDFFIQPDEKT